MIPTLSFQKHKAYTPYFGAYKVESSVLGTSGCSGSMVVLVNINTLTWDGSFKP